MADQQEQQFLRLIEAAEAAGALSQAQHYRVALGRYRLERAETQAASDAPGDVADNT